MAMLSLATSNVVAVREFGIGSAVGIMVDFAISLVLVPIFVLYVGSVGGDFLDLYRFFVPVLPLVDRAEKNAAVVLVTAELPPFAKPGQRLDITVASMGKAKAVCNYAVSIMANQEATHDGYEEAMLLDPQELAAACRSRRPSPAWCTRSGA